MTDAIQTNINWANEIRSRRQRAGMDQSWPIQPGEFVAAYSAGERDFSGAILNDPDLKHAYLYATEREGQTVFQIGYFFHTEYSFVTFEEARMTVKKKYGNRRNMSLKSTASKLKALGGKDGE